MPPASSMLRVRPMRSAANLISGEVATIREVAGWMRRPAINPARRCISRSESWGAANTTTSSFSPDAEGGEVIGADGCGLGNRAAMKGCRERWCLRGDTHQVEQGNRTKARERRAKMFELVGVGGRGHPADDRDLPVTVGGATDNAPERAPIGEVSRLGLEYKMASS